MSVQVLIERVPVPCEAQTLFRCLVGERHVCFLDSVIPHAELGRYSILCSQPFLILRSRGETVERIWTDRVERIQGNPWDVLRTTLRLFDRTPSLDLPFAGGAVGYFAYDLGRFVEELPQHAQDDLGLPECWLAFYATAYVWDQQSGDFFLIATHPDRPDCPGLAHERMARLKRALSRVSKVGDNATMYGNNLASPQSNFDRESYFQAIGCIQKYIAAGDIYQANLSQRFHVRWRGEPSDLYLRLRQRNPAPFAAYLDTGECVVLSSSPERFLKMDARTRQIETRPIKGTRPRGATPEEDALLKQQLADSVKDRAELLMIVDLERNDLGRVCEIGSVEVPSLFRVESYATVHHLVSTVVGRLAPSCDTVDLLCATFPGGSITGAPKIRAMEIIEEIEPTRRHIYTGAIGYLSFSGDLDLNIAIRTMLLKGEDVYFQLGGGIVADSDPLMEYEETLHKGRALLELFG